MMVVLNNSADSSSKFSGVCGDAGLHCTIAAASDLSAVGGIVLASGPNLRMPEARGMLFRLAGCTPSWTAWH